MIELESATIQKYQKSTTAVLKNRAVMVFNTWIRNRDDGKCCISCGSCHELQAGHFYSAGKHNHMRFLEDNVNVQCMKCNYFLSGNLLKYREKLIAKIGLDRVEKLDLLASQRMIQKIDRFHLIEVIEKYKLRKK